MTDHERLGPPPVEPLSDVAWARVERNVFSRVPEGTVTSAAAAREVRPEPRSKWLWLAVPLAAAAAAMVAFYGRTDKPQPVTAAAEPEPARVVASDSPSAVTFGDAHMMLDAQSAITIAPKAVTLEYGGAWFEVTPRDDKQPFVVVAGDLSVKVVGTRFRVARTAEHSEVEVDHGVVEVRYHGKQTTLHAHEHWTSEGGN
jgi:ferric-dicitrate binding protein FerR (iron transport regulator)